MSIYLPLVNYLNKTSNDESFIDKDFIAIRKDDLSVLYGHEKTLEYLRSLRDKIKDINAVNEDSHYIFYLLIDDVKYIMKVKYDDNNKLSSLVLEKDRGVKNILLFIEYDGSAYGGMQRLNGVKTIQGEIEDALYKMLKRKVDIRIASRTDKGVHAKMQAVSFESSKTEPQKYKFSLNSILPPDIRVKEAYYRSQLFDPRYDVKKKTYEYIIDTSLYSVFNSKHVLYHNINDIEGLREELKSIIGTHDFVSFCKGEKDGTIRTIYDADITKEGSIIKLTFTGSGFLHNMIRLIVGTLIDIDEHHEYHLKDILESKNKRMTPYLISPCGLYLVNIEY